MKSRCPNEPSAIRRAEGMLRQPENAGDFGPQRSRRPWAALAGCVALGRGPPAPDGRMLGLTEKGSRGVIGRAALIFPADAEAGRLSPFQPASG